MPSELPLEEWPHLHKLPNGVLITKLHDTDMVISNGELFSYSKAARDWAGREGNRSVLMPPELCPAREVSFWAAVMSIRAFDAGLKVQLGSDITFDPLNVTVVDETIRRFILEEHPLKDSSISIAEAIPIQTFSA